MKTAMAKRRRAHDAVKGEELLALEGVTFSYPSETRELAVIRDCDLTIRRGDVIGVTGRNGAGKTTLLRLIAGQLTPTSGRMQHHRQDVRIVYLNQNASDFLAPALTVSEQLLMAMGTYSSPLQSPHALVVNGFLQEHLSGFQVGLEDRFDRFTHELSGGQRQIVALLAVILADADVLLLDEYSAFMDEKSRSQSTAVLETLCKAGSTAILVVDHRGTLDGSLSSTITLEGGRA